MYGIQAITANNGWAMAIIGATIVFCGLAFLATVIYQFPKLFLFLDWLHGKRIKRKQQKKVPPPSLGDAPHFVSSHIEEVARLYKPLIEQLPAQFSLANVYALSTEYDYPHPYISVSQLRNANILVPTGENDLFQWNSDVIP